MSYRDLVPSPAALKAWLDAITGDEKFVLVLGCGVVNSILLWFGKLDQTSYVTLTTLTIGAYLTGKAVETVNEKNNDAKVQIAQAQSEATVSVATAATAASAAATAESESQNRGR